MPKTKLELSVDVYRSLINPTIVRGRVSGELPAETFQQYIDELETAKLLLESDKNKRTLTFSALSSNSGEFFAASMEDFLRADSRKKKTPSHFYIVGEDQIYTATSEQAPLHIKGYLDAVALYEIFKDVADHGKEPDSNILIFFHKEKVELTIDYASENLQPLPKLAEFKAKFIDDDIHTDQKKTIIKAVLQELSKEFDEKLKISHIIERFDEFFRRTSSGYQLYVSEFSFQKVKAEVEKSKFEFITKMNKVFSDIQNQLLTVPAALIIAGSQFEKADHITLKNIIILVGVLAFTIFMILLIINQRNTLKSLISEIDNEWSLIKNKHQTIKIQFNEQYEALASRYKYQYSLLELVCFIVVLACMTTILLFRYYSDNATTPIETAVTLGFFLAAYIIWRGAVLFNVLFYNRLEDNVAKK
ncbi:hypothetical protein [Pseudomonas neuropathica]|uniref:Uncharacterized protein n=1 Tax=Pseudomonas neuropathica TaxID=2730425 RepID=A0ACC7MPC1_9PSED